MFFPLVQIFLTKIEIRMNWCMKWERFFFFKKWEILSHESSIKIIHPPIANAFRKTRETYFWFLCEIISWFSWIGAVFVSIKIGHFLGHSCDFPWRQKQQPHMNWTASNKINRLEMHRTSISVFSLPISEQTNQEIES